MADFSAEQLRNASIIASVGRQVGASDRDILIGIMVAFQESGLRNLNYGHLDSIGMFQQRNAWASRSERLDPAASARMFFQGGHGGQPGLLDNKSRNRQSLTQAGQWVQRSAFPNAYAKWEDEARQVLGMAPSAGGGGGGFTRPVFGGTITQRFGDPAPPGVTYARGYKNGMSFAAPAGTPVLAASGGRVVRVASGGAYGNRVEIEHGGKVWTVYAHMSGTNVQVGDQVRPGQMIGRVGKTGQATGNHLHFELRTGANQYGRAVDPQDFLNMSMTPSAGIQEMSTFIGPSSDPSMFGQADPFSNEYEMKPYQYVNPLDNIASGVVGVDSSIPGVREEWGGMLSEEDHIEYRATPPDPTEVQTSEEQEEARGDLQDQVR